MKNNPAARLHAILMLAKEQKGSTPTIIAWKNILDLQTDEDLEIMGMVGKVFTLPLAVTYAVNQIPALHQELYLSWKSGIENAFRANTWNGNIQEFLKHINDTMLVSLQFVSDNLGRLAPEITLNEKNFEELRQGAWNLYEEISNSDMDSIVKDYLLKHMSMILRALDDYPILGIQPLNTAIETCIGTVVTQEAKAKNSNDTKAGSDFWKFTAKILVALKIAQSTVNLGNDAVQFLQKCGILDESESSVSDH